jgi:hypothetical protein
VIGRLTPLQAQRLAAGVDRWLAQAASTQPLDRAAAAQALCEVYRAAGEPRPEVLFFSSPPTCLLAWGVLWRHGPYDPRRSYPERILASARRDLGLDCLGALQCELASSALARVMSWIEALLRIPLNGRALMLQRHIHDTIAPARNLAPLLYQARAQLPQPLLAACEPQTLLQVLKTLRGFGFLASGLAGPWECARELLFDGCVQLGIVREARPSPSGWSKAGAATGGCP